MTKLKDVQKEKDIRKINLQKVGVKDVETPLIIERKECENQTVYAKSKMSVSLPHNFKGTHMSRFIEILNDFREKNMLSTNIKLLLEKMCEKLDAKDAYARFDFKYFIEKEAPVSKMKSQMGYDCFFEGKLKGSKYNFYLGATVPITTLCPCSKEISDYGAHNQRANVSVKISYDIENMVWLEDLIKEVESCASSELYPLLKRKDEKFVTEYAYNNPKFVEDVMRDIVLKFEKNKVITFYEVEIDSLESIHNHSAWCYQKSEEK